MGVYTEMGKIDESEQETVFVNSIHI